VGRSDASSSTSQRAMSVVLTQTSGGDYTPKYLFVSGDRQHGTGKSRHVMKEFLRKRDSIRRQHQLAARSKSRVLPWLRREDMEQPVIQAPTSSAIFRTPSECSSESSSVPPSPRPVQGTTSHVRTASTSSLIDCTSRPGAKSSEIPQEQPHSDKEVFEYGESSHAPGARSR
jgi:hypothetical protein